MNRITKYIKAMLAISITLLSLHGLPSLGLQHAYAADCTQPGPAAQLAIYSTNKPSPFDRPDPSLDPQDVAIGQQSVNRMEVELEDANGCAVDASATVHYTLSTSGHAVDFLTTSGVNKGETFSDFIAKNSSRKGFFVLGKNNNGIPSYSATLTAVNTDATAYITATQTVNIVAPAPVATKIVFQNNAHSTLDSILGLAGAALPSAVFIRAYTADGSTLLGFTTVNADGSFGAISTGDDSYRQVLVSAEYAGGVFSNAVLFDQTYPGLVTDFTVTHGSNDQPVLHWTATEAGASFRIYRAPAVPTPTFTEVQFIGSSSVPSFTDTTFGFNLGVAYQYVVKQVSPAGSYTPEFLPTINVRFDLSSAVFTPAGSVTTDTAPSATFVVSQSLLASWQSNPAVITARYTNVASGLAYSATLTETAGNQFQAKAPYVDANGQSLAVLPDGSYSSVLSAIDATAGINDSIKNQVTYTIDSIAPNAPALSNLRFASDTVSGLANAVEAGASVDIYSSAVLVSSNLVGTAVASSDGSFVFTPVTIPTAGVFYLVARDTAGNKSPATAFDVVSIPSAPVVTKVSIEQNAPGAEDRVVGAEGAVASNITVRIYASDPSLSAGLIPLYELAAHANGSFAQTVGDNKISDFWVATWSGADRLSPAIHLVNHIFISAPTNFRASAGDAQVTLHWDAVAAASFYTVTVFDTGSGQSVQSVTVVGSQTSLQLTLQNGHTYRFTIQATDGYGNRSEAKTVESSPRAHTITVAAVSETTTPTPSAESSHIAQSPAPQKEVTDVVAPAPAPSSPTPTSESRDWTTWIIVGLGILLLALAAFFGWQLMYKQPVETVTTIKKPTPAKPEQSEKKNGNQKDEPKPRW